MSFLRIINKYLFHKNVFLLLKKDIVRRKVSIDRIAGNHKNYLRQRTVIQKHQVVFADGASDSVQQVVVLVDQRA